LRTQRKKKKKLLISGTTRYREKGNYLVNDSVLELVEKELGFEKNGSKKMAIFYIFLDVNS